MNKGIIKNIRAYGTMGLFGIVYLAQIGISTYANSKFHDLGDGLAVREIFGNRTYYLGNYNGSYRFCSDNNRDGLIDNTFVAMPLSPLMGGPGYSLLTVKTTREDIIRFEEAKRLFSLERKNATERRNR